MKATTATVSDPVGFHLRAAGRIVKLTKRFAAEVTIRYNGRAANAKSIMGLASLAAECGSRVDIEADGPRRRRRLSTRSSSSSPSNSLIPSGSRDLMRTLRGIAASPGYAVGPVHRIVKGPPEFRPHGVRGRGRGGSGPVSRRGRPARAEIRVLMEKLERELGPAEARILVAICSFSRTN